MGVITISIDDKVEEKLNSAEIILKERKTHLKELKKDRDQALRYKDLSDKLKQNKATHLHLYITKKNDKKSGFTRLKPENIPS